MVEVIYPQIGIVVPTLGTRIDYLRQALESIRSAGHAYVVIVAPNPHQILEKFSTELFDLVIEDPKDGLPQAINVGMNSMPRSIKYANWLGDDDLLLPNSLTIASQVLEESPGTVCVYGGCSYIGPRGEVLWINKSGKYAKWLIRFGPQLIPQPGSLFTLNAFNELGGLNKELKWAFDLDLLIRLTRCGRLGFIPFVLSSFRWHADSLSVGGRQGSVKEASQIRKKALPKVLKIFSPLWEFPIQYLILFAGTHLSSKSKKYP